MSASVAVTSITHTAIHNLGLRDEHLSPPVIKSTRFATLNANNKLERNPLLKLPLVSRPLLCVFGN